MQKIDELGIDYCNDIKDGRCESSKYFDHQLLYSKFIFDTENLPISHLNVKIWNFQNVKTVLRTKYYILLNIYCIYTYNYTNYVEN